MMSRTRKRRIEELDDPTTELETQYVDKDLTFRLVREGNAEEFKALVNRVILCHARDKNGNSYLHEVLPECFKEVGYKKFYPLLQYLINEAPSLLLSKNNSGKTPLCLACRLNVIPVVIKLLATRCIESINVPDEMGKTPLMYLICNFCVIYEEDLNICDHSLEEMLQTAQFLIDNGADVNFEDKENKNVLHHVITNTDELSYRCNCIYIIPKVKFLLKNGVNIISSTGINALSIIDIVEHAKLLINHDISALNTVNRNESPLYCALIYQRKNTFVELLLDNGALLMLDLDPIHLTRTCGYDFNIINKLLKNMPNYDINTKNDDGQTLLIRSRNNSEIEQFLQLGADPSIVSNEGNNVLGSMKVLNLNLVARLILKGADPFIFTKLNNSVILAIFIHALSYRRKSETRTYFLAFFKLIFNLPHIKMSPMTWNFYSICEIIIIQIFRNSLPIFNYRSSENWKNSLLKISMVIKYVSNAQNMNNILLDSNFKLSTINKDYIFLDSKKLDPISYLMMNFIKLIPISGNEYKIEEFLTMVLDSGLTLSNISEIYVTPFVLLFYLFRNDSIVENKIRLNLLQKFIKSGINTELNGLYLKKTKLSIGKQLCENINYFREFCNIPDALFLAFLFKKKECVELLVDHYWAPPLTLLLCHPKLNLYELEYWLPVFVKYGGIPHGTYIFHQFKNKIGSLKRIIADYHEYLEGDSSFMAAWDKCLEYTSSPLSLQVLCKYKIRESLAVKSSHPDTSLPSLLVSLCPLSVPVFLLLQH